MIITVYSGTLTDASGGSAGDWVLYVTYAGLSQVGSADEIVCVLEPEVFQIPSHAGDKFYMPSHQGDVFQIVAEPGDTFRC